MAEFLEPQQPPRRPRQGATPPQQDTLAADLYRQGVQAFKQGRDREALAWFQQLTQLPTATPQVQLKGRMGLILTQQRLGQVDQARQGCQQVLASGIPQARQWAESVLEKLPPPTQTPPGKPTPPALPTSDPTGFMPLPPPVKTASAPVAEPQDGGKPAPPLAKPDAGFRPDPDGISLFHYQQLNQEAGAEPSDPANPSQASSATQDRGGTVPVPQPVSTDSQPRPQRQTVPPQTVPPRQGQRPSQGPRRPPLGSPHGLWAVQIVTVLATLWVTTTGLHLLFRGVNTLLRQVTWPIRLGGIALLNRSYTGPIVVLFLGLMLTSPWWMDYLLAQIYGQRPLTARQLQGTHPEVLKRLRQQCRQRGWYLPELRLLPTTVPLCFSYGWRPRYLRIVVSQGLLDSGDDEMLGMFYAYELAHMVNQATAVISGLGGFLLILHTLHGRLAQWREGRSSRFPKVALGGLAYGCYGLFWSLRRGLLWLSRRRSEWADRRVEALTQRPDLQQQHLCWLTSQLPAHLAQRGTLHPLWASLDILMPLSPQAALSPGSFIPTLGAAATVLDDWANPYRHWLVGGASHPPLGERLFWLNQRAIQRQQPALNLAEPVPSPLPSLSIPRLMRQKSPVLGLLLGGGIALVFWFVGGLVLRLEWTRLSWWYQDESLLYGGVLLGLGLGLLTRINALYPDILAIQPPISEARLLLGSVDQLPVEGAPCRLSGTLISPLDNGQAQDLYLATLGGMVKLGFSSPQPMLWALRPTPSPLKPWVGRSVTVSGWRRRNDGVVWVDVATIGLSSQRQVIPIVAPIWATMISLGLCLWGVFVIFTGA